MGGSSSSSNVKTEIRYAPYIEEKHASTLNVATAARESIIDHSPYADYSAPDANTAFFSLGFMLSNFPSLNDTFGKNMAGLDIDSLFSTNFSEKMETALADNVVESELSIFDDAIEQSQESKIKARNLNAQGSTFIIAQADIEADRIKKTTEFRIGIKYSLIPGVVDTWTATLRWDKGTVTKYAECLKDYYLCKISVDEANYQKKTEDTIWPLTVLDFERTILAAMLGTRVSRVMTARERSDLSKGLLVASYTVQGAQLGSMVPGIGTIAGAVVGFTIGIAVMLME